MKQLSDKHQIELLHPDKDQNQPGCQLFLGEPVLQSDEAFQFNENHFSNSMMSIRYLIQNFHRKNSCWSLQLKTRFLSIVNLKSQNSSLMALSQKKARFWNSPAKTPSSKSGWFITPSTPWQRPWCIKSTLKNSKLRKSQRVFPKNTSLFRKTIPSK